MYQLIQKRLKNTSANTFHEAWELYEDAFPLQERRLLHEQKYILQNDKYHFDVYFHKNQFTGFLLWWNFDTFWYIDHFATILAQRNKGIGKQILQNFINRNATPIILEVELPSSHIEQRRIQFYERLGFQLNHHYYEIPPSEKNQSPLQLLLMSYPHPLTDEDVAVFVEKHLPMTFSPES